MKNVGEHIGRILFSLLFHCLDYFRPVSWFYFGLVLVLRAAYLACVISVQQMAKVDSFPGCSKQLKRATSLQGAPQWSLYQTIVCRHLVAPQTYFKDCLPFGLFQLSELNTFFLKQIFFVPPSHVLNLFRLVLICVISAPTIRYSGSSSFSDLRFNIVNTENRCC